MGDFGEEKAAIVQQDTGGSGESHTTGAAVWSSARFLCALVFSPGGQTAPQMPLRFVLVQQRPHLKIQWTVQLIKPLRQVLVS